MPLGRIEDRHVDEVAEGRIAARRRARRREYAMRVQVGRIEVEIGLAGIGHMLQLVGVNLRQPVDEADLQGVARHQGKAGAAIRRYRAAARGTTQSGRRPRADLIDPPGRMDDRAAVRRRERYGRNGLRHSHHHDVQHAVPACEHGWIDKIGGVCRSASCPQSHDDAGCANGSTQRHFKRC